MTDEASLETTGPQPRKGFRGHDAPTNRGGVGRGSLCFFSIAGLALVWFSMGAATLRQGSPSHAALPPPPARLTLEGSPDLLVVGGGPSTAYNQVAIESNVRYVLSLFETAHHRTVLFADGNPQSRTVLYEDMPDTDKPAEFLVDLVLDVGSEASALGHTALRVPRLPQLDGPSARDTVFHAFSKFEQQGAERPLVLYFTGHGSEGEGGDHSLNTYELWNGRELTVTDLAGQIARLRAGRPVTLIMAQCFSGAFAATILRGGKSGAPLASQDLAGFFGTTSDRVAAGCTPDVHEAHYQDFTSYFMAALGGRDRMGAPVTGADYNHDDRIGMNEAFCYALIHDPTVDVPVCTSDAFLRDRVVLSDRNVFRTSFKMIRTWADPAQAAAMDSLAASLTPGESGTPDTGATNPDLQAVYDDLFTHLNRRGFNPALLRQYQRLSGGLIQQVIAVRRRLLRRWPVLRHKSSAGFAEARTEAIQDITSDHQAEAESITADYEKLQHLTSTIDDQEVASARQLRLLRLAKTVALTHVVMTNGPEPVRRDLLRVLKAESRPLFAIAPGLQ